MSIYRQILHFVILTKIAAKYIFPVGKCIFPLKPRMEMYISTGGNGYFRKWKRIFPPHFAETVDTQGFENSFLLL